MVAALEAEFAALQRSKDATARTLEPRVRVMRYAAELAKFRLFPHGAAFSQLKGLLDDFQGHNVDAACAMVETAGRFFYRWVGGWVRCVWGGAGWMRPSLPRRTFPCFCPPYPSPPAPLPPLPKHRLPETTTRMTNFLEVMMKLRNARNLDARQSSLVDSAYFATKAGDRAAARRRTRPPMHEYIRHLVYQELPGGAAAVGPSAGGGNGCGGGAVTKVLKKLRRLPWAAHERYLVRTLVRASHKGRFSQIPAIASLAAGLARYHPSLGVALVDEVLEAVQAGLEAPEAGGVGWVGGRAGRRVGGRGTPPGLLTNAATAPCRGSALPLPSPLPCCCTQSLTSPVLPTLPTLHPRPRLPCPRPPCPLPPPGFYQRRVAHVRLLGELYNYKLVNSHVIFATLHLILAFGHEAGTPPDVSRWVRRWGLGGAAVGWRVWDTDAGGVKERSSCHIHTQPRPPARRRLDPPSNYFRIRLVCTLLHVCGQYFARGAPRRKLDALLPLLQRYLLAKPPLPLDVEFDVQVRVCACVCVALEWRSGSGGVDAVLFNECREQEAARY